MGNPKNLFPGFSFTIISLLGAKQSYPAKKIIVAYGDSHRGFSKNRQCYWDVHRFSTILKNKIPSFKISVTMKLDFMYSMNYWLTNKKYKWPLNALIIVWERFENGRQEDSNYDVINKLDLRYLHLPRTRYQ
jgi:hypothetical protein